MRLSRVDRLAGLILCLTGLIPACSLAAPDLARATATVTARVLAPVSLAVSYDTSQASPSPRFMVLLPANQVFQLHINSARHHSYEQHHLSREYPLPTAPSALKSANTSRMKQTVTLYFN